LDYRIKAGSSVRSHHFLKVVLVLLVISSLLLLPLLAYAAGGGKPATKLYNVADTRNMEPGLSKWIADIYNDNLWTFGLLVVAIMAIMGLALGYLMDRSLVLLGINLGKLDHHE